MDDERAGPRPSGEVGIEVERIAVAGEVRERLHVLGREGPRPRPDLADGRRRPAHLGYSRSNRSTGTTNTVAPPTSTSSG